MEDEVRKKFLFPLAALFIVIILVLIVPFVPFGSWPAGTRNKFLYVTHNPIHTGFLFPYSEEWKDFPTAKYLEFSWGDRDFFVNVPTWDKLTIPVALDALFTPDPGFMHVDTFDKINVPYTKIMVTEEQYQKIRKFILGSFLMKDGKVVEKPGLSSYGTDRFYESTINYHAFKTCNEWTREGLAQADVPMPLWTFHKWGVLFQL